MITFQTNQLSDDMINRYHRLFNNAYNDLVAYATIDSEGNKTYPYKDNTEPFTDLSDYYAHMMDYIRIGKPIYLLLPLDEGHFTINANTRQITVPTEFNQCGGVTNDNLCEIATFTIDRYYDFVDLAGDNVNIVVEWRNAAGEEGVTGINLIDLDTYFDQGKIRFGWPIGLEITKKEGPVNFAVKFFMKDENGKFTHVLNTLPATITIKKGLSISDPSLYENAETHFGTLSSIAVNSGVIPNMPAGVNFIYYSWQAPGVIQQSAKLVDDTLELIVEGSNSDQREMDYEWYRATWEEDLNDHTWKINEATETLIDSENANYTQDTVYEVFNGDRTATFPIHLALYVSAGGGETYSRYTGNDWPENPETLLYKCRNRLTFIKGIKEDITGRYYAKAYNRVYKKEEDGTEKLIGESYQKSPFCYIYKPDVLQYTENGNLPEYKSLVKGPISLEVNFIESLKDPDVTHEWRRYDTIALANGDKIVGGEFSQTPSEGDNPEIEIIESDDDIDTISKSSRLINKAGYYKVLTKNTLNRTTQTEVSNICKVTGELTAPEIASSSFGVSNDLNNLKDIPTWIKEYKNPESWAGDSPTSFEVDGGQIFFLTIKPTPKTELASDKFTYKWSYIPQDSNTEIILTNNKSVQGDLKLVPVNVNITEDSDIIVLRCNWDDEEVITIYCEIINHLSGETLSTNKQVVTIKNKGSEE